MNVSPTLAASVQYTVTFSEAVTGVAANDFNVQMTGTLAGASVTGVSGSGTVYTVTVSTGTGVGTLRLVIPATATIGAPLGNTVANLPFTTAPVYEVRVQTFADVPTTYWAWSWIERLYDAGVTGGCSTNPLAYCPDNSVTRAQMAVFLLKAKYGSAYTPPPATGTVFTDVPVTHFFAAWIEQLAAEGITGGCGPGLYCPNNPVTRAQMAVFLLKARYGATYSPPPLGDGSGFTDVPATNIFAPWIKQLATEGITGGCGPGLYCPNNPVTRGQMAVFLIKTFDLP